MWITMNSDIAFQVITLQMLDPIVHYVVNYDIITWMK